MEARRSVQVVDVLKGTSKVPVFKLNIDALKQVLLQDHVKDLPVVVLSIAGKYRDGKSFFMNLVEGFLRNKSEDNSWLTPGNMSSGCFEWESGSDGCTSGIWICAELFVLEGPDGEKIAVLLMDTQGTFDTASSMKECSTIFALSTLLSNLQIYNLKEKFLRDDLEALKMFVEFGKEAQGQGNKPFKALKFLIRDWGDPKYPYGAKGGNLFVEDQKEKTNILKDIAKQFEMVDCSLLPMPWNNCQSRMKREESITDLSSDFKDHLTELLSSTLSWENLQKLVKTDLSGYPITTKEIVSYFTAYIETFDKDGLLVPKSAFEANVEVSLMKAVERALQHFDVFIVGELGAQSDDSPSVPIDELNAALDSAQRQTVEYFESTVGAMKNIGMTEGYYLKLLQEINARILFWSKENSLKKSKEEDERFKVEIERVRKETDEKIEDIESRRRNGEIALASLTQEMARTKEENEASIRALESTRDAFEQRIKENKEAEKAREEREHLNQIEMDRKAAEKAETKREKKEKRRLIKETNDNLQTASNATSLTGHIVGGVLAIASYIPIPEISLPAKAMRAVGLVILPVGSNIVSKVIERFKKDDNVE